MRKFLIKLLTFLLVAEIVLRMIWHPLGLDARYVRNDYPWLRENVVLNSMNWRDKEYDPDNKNGNYRILFLGGSYTFGWYINNVNKTFPRRLENNLVQDFPDQSFDIINASRHGFSVAEQLGRLKNEGIWFHPNLVVKGISFGEFNHKTKVFLTPPKFITDSYFYRELIDKPFRDLQVMVDLRDYENGFSENSPEFSTVTKDLLEMKRIANENGAKFAILIFPEFDPGAQKSTYLHENYHQSIRRFAKENDILAIDPLASFLEVSDKTKLVINSVDPHPSEFAHELVADAIMKQYDFRQNLKSFKSITPKLKTKVIRNVGNKLEDFRHVRNITSQNGGSYTVVYFERKNGLDVQSRAPGKLTDRKLIFLEDKLKSVKSYTHQGWPGAVIEYNFEPAGNRIILPSLYGFPIVGVKQFTAYWRDEEKHSEVADWLQPESVSLNNGELVININPKRNYFLYKIEVVVGVQQIDINEDGGVEDITSTKNLSTTLTEGSTKISFDTNEKVGSYPTFLSNDGTFPWAFVDGVMTLAKSASIEDKKFILYFGNIIKSGSRIWVPVSIRQDGGLSFSVEYE